MGSRTDEVAVGLAVVMLISVPAPFRSTAHSPQGQLPVGTPKVISSDAANGVETFASPRSFLDSVSHFESLLAARGLTLFAKIDFTSDAKNSGLDMPPTLLLVFGNPKAGTPV